MGREIRRVPVNWEHPKRERWDAFHNRSVSSFQPLYDRSFKDACDQWIADFKAFMSENPSGVKTWGENNKNESVFWEWETTPPDREWYRPEWSSEDTTAYQIYENVSEGTPVSPVFQTQEEMKTWLMDEWELSETAADHFIKTEYSFSMIMTSDGISSPGAGTIEAMAKLDESDD